MQSKGLSRVFSNATIQRHLLPCTCSKRNVFTKTHAVSGSLFLYVLALPPVMLISGPGRGVGHPQTLPPGPQSGMLTCSHQLTVLGDIPLWPWGGTCPPGHAGVLLNQGSPVAPTPSALNPEYPESSQVPPTAATQVCSHWGSGGASRRTSGHGDAAWNRCSPVI